MEGSDSQYPINPFLSYSHDSGSEYFEYIDSQTNIKYYTHKQTYTTIFQDPTTGSWPQIYPPMEKLASPPRNPFLYWGPDNGEGFSVFTDRYSNTFYTNINTEVTYFLNQHENKFIQIYPPDPPSEVPVTLPDPQPTEPEKSPQDEPQEINIADVIHSILCSECSSPDIDLFLPGCRHPYHIACFNQFCLKCSKEVRIPLLKPTPSSCFKCSSKENLLSCDSCQQKCCFLCVHKNDLPNCCSKILDNLKDYSEVCPGCEYRLSYTEFLPFSHKAHSLLCKKCILLGMKQKECILGCKLRESLNEYVNCKCCENLEISYNGNFECKNKCVVCFECQWHENFKKGKREMSCCYCDEDLVEVGLD